MLIRDIHNNVNNWKNTKAIRISCNYILIFWLILPSDIEKPKSQVDDSKVLLLNQLITPMLLSNPSLVLDFKSLFFFLGEGRSCSSGACYRWEPCDSQMCWKRYFLYPTSTSKTFFLVFSNLISSLSPHLQKWRTVQTQRMKTLLRWSLQWRRFVLAWVCNLHNCHSSHVLSVLYKHRFVIINLCQLKSPVNKYAHQD